MKSKTKNKVPPWLRPKTPSQELAVGIGWYTEEEWGKVKAAAVDAERFEASYSEWLQMAEDSLAHLRATGIMAEKSYVNADALLAWCLAYGKRNDGAARAEFVSKMARHAGKGGA